MFFTKRVDDNINIIVIDLEQTLLYLCKLVPNDIQSLAYNCRVHVFRHAALMAISAVGEGCHKQMEAILPQIMDGVIQYLQDPVSLITIHSTI